MNLRTIFGCALVLVTMNSAHAAPGGLADLKTALQVKTDQFKKMTSFQLTSEAYVFAQGTRKLEYDTQREAFAEKAAKNGATYLAAYETAYVFAIIGRQLEYDTQRDTWADQVAGSQTPLTVLPLYMEAYNFAKTGRALTYDAQRTEFAQFAVRKDKPELYLATYEDAYVFARDVRKLQYDTQRAEFAEQQADIAVSSVIAH